MEIILWLYKVTLGKLGEEYYFFNSSAGLKFQNKKYKEEGREGQEGEREGSNSTSKQLELPLWTYTLGKCWNKLSE